MFSVEEGGTRRSETANDGDDGDDGERLARLRSGYYAGRRGGINCC